MNHAPRSGALLRGVGALLPGATVARLRWLAPCALGRQHARLMLAKRTEGGWHLARHGGLGGSLLPGATVDRLRWLAPCALNRQHARLMLAKRTEGGWHLARYGRVASDRRRPPAGATNEPGVSVLRTGRFLFFAASSRLPAANKVPRWGRVRRQPPRFACINRRLEVL
jgi:hypothetical protein